MRLAHIIIPGDLSKPAIVFIHGLGMDKRIWESPDDARILGGRFPIHLITGNEPETEVCVPHCAHAEHKGLFFGKAMKPLKTLFHDLKEDGFTVIAWSQQRPAAEIDTAVTELRGIISSAGRYTKKGIVLVGHSKGGLIARKYLERRDKKVKALITLSAPHRGSMMAQWAGYLNPLLSIIGPLMPDSEKNTFAYTLKRVIDFLRGRAVKELLPGSPFFKNLADKPRDEIYYMSAGGTDPAILQVYRWSEHKTSESPGEKVVLKPQKLLSVPDIFESLIPKRLFPAEMTKDYGDGLVSAASSRLPWADEHQDFDVNHAGILFDKRVRTWVTASIKKAL